jgi:hypothetical protein
MSITNRKFPSWTTIAVIVIPLVVGGLGMIFQEGLIVSFGYGLLGIAFIILFTKSILWEPIWVRLACVKIEVQSSGIMGIYPPLPDNPIYGRMEPLEVKFKLSSMLRVQPDNASLCIDKNVFYSHTFRHEEGEISGVIFEAPINWFKGQSRKAYIIVSANGREWRSQEFEIKVNN